MKSLKQFLPIIVTILGVAALTIGLMLLKFYLHALQKPEKIGVSFSQVQAERYGSNWQDNYIALLDDLQFKHIRVATYWDRLEPAPDKYDFSELDYMAAEAQKRNAKLTIVLGQKTLRVPECYYPAWLNRQNPVLVNSEVKEMITAVVERYKQNPTIAAWQLENEFLLHSFGDCPVQNLTSAALQSEYQLLRELDSSRPIVITQSNQNGFPARNPYGDIYGFSMYRWVWGALGYQRYPQSGLYNFFKAATISFYTNTQVKIHELQAEAWGPKGNENLSTEEAYKSMNPQLLHENIEYARQTQIKEFDLWGSEWWWHLLQNGNPEMWNAVRALPNKS